MSGTLFVLLFMYAITVAVALIAMEAGVSMDVAFFATLVGLLNILSQMGIYCNLSENVTSDLECTGEVFYESPWYNLQIRVQKLYALPIQQSQIEFRLKGLGIIECSLTMLASVRQID